METVGIVFGIVLLVLLMADVVQKIFWDIINFCLLVKEIKHYED